MERETGFEPATSSLGTSRIIESRRLRCLCHIISTLANLAKSAICLLDPANRGTNEVPPIGSLTFVCEAPFYTGIAIPYFALGSRQVREYRLRRDLRAKRQLSRPRKSRHVATPHPKKSVSSGEIGQPRASADARIGQSSGSRKRQHFYESS